MPTDLNPYQPPQEATANHEPATPWSEPDGGELGAILLIVKGVSIVFGGLLFLLMTIWWISTLLMSS